MQTQADVPGVPGTADAGRGSRGAWHIEIELSLAVTCCGGGVGAGATEDGVELDAMIAETCSNRAMLLRACGDAAGPA